MIDKLCIIGIGLIGGSLARALRDAGTVREIIGYGRSVGNLQQAVELGVIDRAEVSLPDAVLGADMIVLAVPVGNMADILNTLGPVLPDQAVVTDVGSVKGSVISCRARGTGPAVCAFRRGTSHCRHRTIGRGGIAAGSVPAPARDPDARSRDRQRCAGARARHVGGRGRARWRRSRPWITIASWR